MKKFAFLSSKTSLFIIGILVGGLIMASIRVATYQPVRTHYHSNFALYLNGVQEKFDNPKYYQEVAICKTSKGISDPQERTHMHNEEAGLVHVHDHAVTWGQFFNNLGMTIGSDFIIDTDGKKYMGDETNKLNLYIDGQDYTDLTSLANMVIKDRQKVLVSFGSINDATIKEELKTIPDNAEEANNSKDPSSCAGEEVAPLSERLRHIF